MAATPGEIWEGLVSPQLTRRYYFGTAIDSDWKLGSEYAYRDHAGEPAEAGTILDIDRPRLLRMTSRLLFLAPARDDPPHRVTWEIEPAGQNRCRVRLTRDGFASETATYRLVADSLDNLLEGLRTVVDRDLLARLARLEKVEPPIVKELTPELAEDFLGFFDSHAFADNPGWSSCYCMEKHVAAEEWGQRTGADNRRDQEARVRSGVARGLLAYVGGRPVGWCNAGPRTSMVGLDSFPNFRTEDADSVGAIVCFVIASQYRRHGIARRLLEAACDSLARQGFRTVEAYPVKKGGSDAFEYRGPLQMYLEAGFKPFRDAPRMTVVRKELAQA